MFFLLAILTAFSVGFFVTPILIKLLHKAQIGDLPGGRKIHKKFIPSMGGIAFFLAASIAMSIWAWQFPLPDIRYLLGAIALVFFVGLRDDMVELKATHKIMGQLVAVLLVIVAADIRIKDLHGFMGVGELNLYVSYGFSAFVILALTNAFNLIDGLDGLASTMAVIVLSSLGVWFYVHGLDSFAVLCFTFLGGILSFLVYNWHPAKIFMGDTGSLTLGFTMGALIIAFMEYNAALPAGSAWKFEPVFSSGIALMIFPLYDMARVFTRRLMQGKGPMTPDKSHVHHFLMRSGLKHNHVAMLLGFIQLAFVILVVALKDYSDHLVLPLISAIALGLGYRLDQVTIKYVKKKVHAEPRVLEVRPLSQQQRRKIKLEMEEIQESKMNLN
ncbi:UDP-N-acetylmuramyl pentapeptide phosphotransferase/UDP-N-acetylglucosamine-1-phosphate transferase [Algoriphagus ornithinivorans]|uniref:UDP-N-acetylmuramyl pentapeptide phosphotransferase/UDP-N-acetylglucosamine-1-phosphate transferase n=1 Tax=Algoriphagus ornithinivorans TaxID=226506 RepID=A0A1I5BQE8_9BACT|nr:MraY family glycosyltransferase [Algoriphagus ornithinivorans]SFN76893.1 UDP-N-acetylmuramyl pentapeptide phosphotransferase/UDP-N-acetylglucosamine-1-phosphate transferase [Algoriphagus ornithinivorans]